MNNRISRRELFFLAAFASSAFADTPAPKINEKDTMAAALGYVSDASKVDKSKSPTYQAGSTCTNCSWYQGKAGDPAGGPCSFFPGKTVDANGWCRMWNQKH
jgi:hypothetical protein